MSEHGPWHCPGCGGLPVLLADGGRKAYCGNKNCPRFMWDPASVFAGLNADREGEQ